MQLYAAVYRWHISYSWRMCMGESERANRTCFFASTLLCGITFQACFATRAKTHLLFPFVNNVQMRVRNAFAFSASVWESKQLFLMLMLSLSFWHISMSAVYCLTSWCYTSANPLCCSPANDQPASKNPTFLWKNRGKWKSLGLNYGSNDKPAFEDHSSRSVKQSY